MSRTEPPPTADTVAFHETLRRVRFPIAVHVAQGRMTVRELLDLREGSVVLSDTAPAGKVALHAGRVEIATGEPAVESGLLVVRIESTGDDRA